MKRFIRWLANVSGVTRDIQIETCRQCGHSMHGDAYWWNGGIMHKEAKYDVANAFFLYAEHLKNGHYGPGAAMMDLRSKVYQAGGKLIEKFS